MTQEDVHFIDKSAESEVGSPAGSAVSVPTLSEPGLLVMDVDSTLIDEEVIDELGVVAGCGEEIAGVTARAMRRTGVLRCAARTSGPVGGPADLRVRHGA